MQALHPSYAMWDAAECHATNSGFKGYVGHDREMSECNTIPGNGGYGECCSYGMEEALHIVMQLLIDEDVPSLGHRRICFNPDYALLGVSIQKHSIYGVNAVLDFTFQGHEADW